MRRLIVEFRGEDWDDEAEAEQIEEQVQIALDARDVDYLDIHVD